MGVCEGIRKGVASRWGSRRVAFADSGNGRGFCGARLDGALLSLPLRPPEGWAASEKWVVLHRRIRPVATCAVGFKSRMGTGRKLRL